MRGRWRAGMLAAFGFVAWSAGAARALDKIPDLNGTWMGAGLRLFIDTARHQGNTDPSRPFEREPFLIRNVTGPTVVFVIGSHLFVAYMDDENTMRVSRDGLFETYTLTRAQPPKRGAVRAR